MAETEKLVPRRRFKEFINSGAWEQRKLGEYYEFKNGLNKGKEFFGAGTPIVNFTDVFHNRGLTLEMLRGKVQLELNEIRNFEVKKGDIFFTRTSETIDEIGQPSVMLEQPQNTVFSGFVLRGRCFLIDDPLENIFKKYVFFTDAFREEMLKKSSMTTRALTSGTAIKNMEFLFPPDKEEQKQIGDFLTNLDNLITLHQRKVKKIKALKSAYLSEMFPAEGECRPKRRFAGFTEDWEQRKLGEVAKYRNGKAHENDISENGEYIVVNSKFVSTDGDVRKYSDQQIEPLFKGELAFVLSDVPNGRAIARTFLIDEDDKYSLNQRIAGITPLEDTYSYFLYILMNRHPYFLKFDDGAKQTNLSVKDVMKFETRYPSYDEQMKIGNYFHSVDNLITLHQRKLEKLQNIKKAFLNEMFI